MTINNISIAIIGGGPGGLTLARLLQMNGANTRVYERDLNREVRVQGSTLDLHHESGLAALRRAGLIDAFYANYRPNADSLKIMDKHGMIHFEEPGASVQPGEIHHRPEIDRGPLRKILLDSLKPGTVIWDSRFVSMEPHGRGWKIFFENGMTAYADVVIGCDGARSVVRPYLTSVKPIYSGVTAVEGTIYHAADNAPNLLALTGEGKIFAFGDEQTLILGAKGDGSLSFYTGCKLPADWVTHSGIDFNDKTSVEHWFDKQFSSWDMLWKELFGSNEVSFVPRPQYYYPTDQSWDTKNNLTIIGDAAHVMPPYAGEGVNMAMQDAFELSEHLLRDEHANVHAAITAFERAMLNRSAAVTELTLQSTAMLHGKDAINQMIGMFSGDIEF